MHHIFQIIRLWQFYWSKKKTPRKLTPDQGVPGGLCSSSLYQCLQSRAHVHGNAYVQTLYMSTQKAYRSVFWTQSHSVRQPYKAPNSPLEAICLHNVTLDKTCHKVFTYRFHMSPYIIRGTLRYSAGPCHARLKKQLLFWGNFCNAQSKDC